MASLRLGVGDMVVEAGAMGLLILLVEDSNPARLVSALGVPSFKGLAMP